MLQFDFDDRYARISEQRIRESAELGKFELVSHECSTLAGGKGKSIVLYFASRSEAERAKAELPRVIRVMEQKDQSYSIKATVLSYHDAQNIIKGAKEQREQQQQGAATAASPQVVILQAPTAYPAQQGFVQSPGMIPGDSVPQHAQPGVYPQATAYAAPAQAAPAYAPGPQYAVADPSAQPTMPVLDELDLAGILSAAGEVPGPTGGAMGANTMTAIPPGGPNMVQMLDGSMISTMGVVAQPGGVGEARPETKPRTEEDFLNVLESLRGGTS